MTLYQILMAGEPTEAVELFWKIHLQKRRLFYST